MKGAVLSKSAQKGSFFAVLHDEYGASHHKTVGD
jgi:hypothetical protein